MRTMVLCAGDWQTPPDLSAVGESAIYSLDADRLMAVVISTEERSFSVTTYLTTLDGVFSMILSTRLPRRHTVIAYASTFTTLGQLTVRARIEDGVSAVQGHLSGWVARRLPTGYPVLVVNPDGRPCSLFPWSLMRWDDALKDSYRGTLDILRHYDATFDVNGVYMTIPAVARLKYYVRTRAVEDVPFCPKPFRRNIFLRDLYRCSYCGRRLTVQEATIDHVTPRSLGGPDTWQNLTTACSACNSKKGSLLPCELHRVDMRMLQWPSEPSQADLQRLYFGLLPAYVRSAWQEFLEAPLEEAADIFERRRRREMTSLAHNASCTEELSGFCRA